MRLNSILISLCLAACGSTELVTPASSAPVRVGHGLAYVDPATASAVLVDPTGKAGPHRDRSLFRVRLGERPSLAVAAAHPGGSSLSRLLVLDPLGEQLFVLEDLSGRKHTVSLGVPLERLAVASGGDWAVAYDPGANTPTSSLFSLPNTVAIVDLRADPPVARALRLGTPGARPSQVVFAESARLAVTVGGTTRAVALRLAMVFVGGGLIPLDLETATAGPFVPLAAADDVDVVPSEVVFGNNRGDALAGDLDGLERAFVRTTEGELFVLSVSVSAEELAANPAYPVPRVALENVITPEAAVTDVELYFDDTGRELLLASAGRQLVLVDGYTGVGRQFPQELVVDTLRRFDDPVTGRALAIAFDASHPGRTVLRLDPLALSQRRASGVETLRLASSVRDVEVVDAAGRAVVRYAGSSELGVLDLARGGDVLDLRFARVPSAMALSPLGDSLWLVTQSPKDEESYLAEVGLADLGTRDVRLDARARSLGAVGELLFVDHDDALGSVTFFPQTELTRDAGVTFHNVLLADLFEVEIEEGELR